MRIALRTGARVSCDEAGEKFVATNISLCRFA
jgi:hypothetical protein